MKILKITNLKTGQVQQSDFTTHAEALAHFEKYKAIGFWGKEGYSITHPERIIHHDEILEVIGQVEVLDAQGNIVIPAIQAVPFQAAYDEVIPAYDEIVPCEYTYSITEEAEKLAAVSPRQIRLALLNLGITEAMIEAQINLLPNPDKEAAMIAFKYSTSFERQLPIVEQIGIALGLTELQLDELWKAGAGL